MNAPMSDTTDTPRDNGGPGFPFASVSQNQATGEATVMQGEYGMTLRDYFAANVMASLGDHTNAVRHSWCMDGFTNSGHIEAAAIAKTAYLIADAMLKARKQ